MDMPVNFPEEENKHRKIRNAFSDYGMKPTLDVVVFPVRDRVIGPVKNEYMKLKSFVSKVKRLQRETKNVRNARIREADLVLGIIQQARLTKDVDLISMRDRMAPWFKQLLSEYVDNEQISVVCVWTDATCYMYKVKNAALKEAMRVDLPEDPGGLCMSASISPYILDECVLTTSQGQCYLWTGDKLTKCGLPIQPRFAVSDSWSHAHFGAHPRELLYCDQTALQLLDIRTPAKEGVDMFALPNKSLHINERLRTCSPHQASTFYTVLATDFSLMLVDQRFPRQPVVKWDHMLHSPPQYICGLSLSSLGVGPDSQMIFVGSQFPAEVHTFQFTGNQPVQVVGSPHRVARYSDLCRWGVFTEQCQGLQSLEERLCASLAGLAVCDQNGRHSVFQMDSHGEIFHQVFTEMSSLLTNQDVTFSAGLGSDDLNPDPIATKIAREWIASWDSLTLAHTQQNMALTDMCFLVEKRIVYLRESHKNCCLCRRELYHTPGILGDVSTGDLCNRCLVSTDRAYHLTQAHKQEQMIGDEVLWEPVGLYGVENLPQGSALSRLLLKHWERDLDIDEELKLWDSEVIELRKKKLIQSQNAVARMDEESVIQRLLGLSIPPSDLGLSEPVGTRKFEVDTSLLLGDDADMTSEVSDVVPYMDSSGTLQASKNDPQKNALSGAAQMNLSDKPFIASKLYEPQIENLRRLASPKSTSARSIVSSSTMCDNDETSYKVSGWLGLGGDQVEKTSQSVDKLVPVIKPTPSMGKLNILSSEMNESASLFSSVPSESLRKKKSKRKHSKHKQSGSSISTVENNSVQNAHSQGCSEQSLTENSQLTFTQDILKPSQNSLPEINPSQSPHNVTFSPNGIFGSQMTTFSLSGNFLSSQPLSTLGSVTMPSPRKKTPRKRLLNDFF
ncbi:TAF1C-like protein [Mya arenaria]|uniref:TAF1C-like protein n=1 Tax=Mya arenaria TaxID=6604 RepID=A0ABY7DUN6_MYAAR|nr:TAF1C-like protein [Mya arenaria]